MREVRKKKGMGPVGRKPTATEVAFMRPVVTMLEDLKYMLTPRQREMVCTIANSGVPDEDDYITTAGNLNALVGEKIIQLRWKHRQTHKLQPKLTPRGRQYYNLYLKEDYERP